MITRQYLTGISGRLKSSVHLMEQTASQMPVEDVAAALMGHFVEVKLRKKALLLELLSL